MNFKDISKGTRVYLVSASDNGVSVTAGEVTSVGMPRFEALRGQLGGSNVTDVSISFGSVQKQFVVPDNSGTILRTEKGDSLVADCTALVEELKRMKSLAEQMVLDGERASKRASTLKDLLTTYDTEYKEKQDNEKRLTNMEQSISELKNMFSAFSEYMGVNKGQQQESQVVK